MAASKPPQGSSAAAATTAAARPPNLPRIRNAAPNSQRSNPAAAAIVRRYYVRPAEELYDLPVDPLEQNNLAAHADHEDRLRDLQRRLDRWMERQGDRRTVFREPYPVGGPKPTEETAARQ